MKLTFGPSFSIQEFKERGNANSSIFVSLISSMPFMDFKKKFVNCFLPEVKGVNVEMWETSSNGLFFVTSGDFASFCTSVKDEATVRLSQSEGIGFFYSVKSVLLNKNVIKSELGPMGAEVFESWSSKTGGVVNYTGGNGGCSIEITHPGRGVVFGLLDCLLRDLPLRGGWPEGAISAWGNGDGLTYFDNGQVAIPTPLVCYRGHEKVTKEQYYSAGGATSISLTASDFVKGYCERGGISESDFYDRLVPMPDNTSPSGWAAVTNSPMSIKSHVDLYMSDLIIKGDDNGN